MKWTMEITDEELTVLIKNNPRHHVENLLARASRLPVCDGRYGKYGLSLDAWEHVCPGIVARVERIKASLKEER